MLLLTVHRCKHKRQRNGLVDNVTKIVKRVREKIKLFLKARKTSMSEPNARLLDGEPSPFVPSSDALQHREL